MATKTASATASEEFSYWIEHDLKPLLLQRQIRPSTVNRLIPHIQYLRDVLGHELNHRESLKPIWDHLSEVISDQKIRLGRQALRRNRELFNRLEQAFGVEAEVITAIWGIESHYGSKRGTYPALSALATLAFRGRRRSYYEDELVAALRLVQTGACRIDQMHGAWSGAMGHAQFSPSAILDFAVDFDGDGVASLCSDNPDDALASLAHFLKKHGWKKGQPWGFEIVLPDGFDCRLVGANQTRSIEEWRKLDITTPDGMPIPDYGPGAIFLPAGAEGVALLALNNFHVLLRYNNCLSYALTIGHLSDRISGSKAFHGSWPLGEVIEKRSELRELQHLLSEAGFDSNEHEGQPGIGTIRAARAWQEANGHQPDGFLSHRLLFSLRGYAT